jgi:hypothetical protein
MYTKDSEMWQVIVVAAVVLGAVVSSIQAQAPAGIAERIMALTRDSQWTLVSSTPMQFVTHHPQGMVKIGDTLFISSVEVKTRTRRFAQPVDGFDRDQGAGVGHVFKIDMKGALLADLQLGEGAIYHPGGMDYDGRYLWVPVSEYRPNSRAIIYRIDPQTMKATAVFRFGDHIGAIVHDIDGHSLHGASWGSRRFYRWPLNAAGDVTNAGDPRDTPGRSNPSHYIDYQDCKYAGGRRMLCTGIADVARGGGERPFTLGGIDLVDLGSGAPVHQVPIGLTTPTGVSVTRNPSFFEATDSGLRAYFVPEDDKATLYVYAIDLRR